MDERLETLRTVFPNAHYVPEGGPVCGAQHHIDPPSGIGEPKLDNCTHTNTYRPPDVIHGKAPWGDWYDEISVTEYLNGCVDFVIIKRPGWYNPMKRHRQSSRSRGDSRSKMDPDVLRRSAIRAKKNLRVAAIQLQVDHMNTFTFAENVIDMDLALDVFETFNRLYKAECPYKFQMAGSVHEVNGWNYVAVPEKQKRGAIHFHVLTNQAHDINRVRSAWVKAQQMHGIEEVGKQVNAKHLRGRRDSYQTIKYVCKYVSKAMSEGVVWKKRYFRSKGIPPPIRKKSYTIEDLSRSDVVHFISDTYPELFVAFCDHRKCGPFECIVGTAIPP